MIFLVQSHCNSQWLMCHQLQWRYLWQRQYHMSGVTRTQQGGATVSDEQVEEAPAAEEKEVRAKRQQPKRRWEEVLAFEAECEVNCTSLGLGLSSDRSEPEMHPFFLYFKWQHHSFRHVALKLHPSSPTKAINCQAWFHFCIALRIGLPRFYYSFLRFLPSSHPNQGELSYLVSQTPDFSKLGSIL